MVWKLQWNGYDPGLLGAVKLAVLPGWTVTSKAAPLSDVTVCAALSLFTTETFEPALTEVGVWNWKFAIVIIPAVGPEDPVGLGGAELVPDGFEDFAELEVDVPEDAHPDRAISPVTARTPRRAVSLRCMG
jgi:hypothetical protein